MPDRIALVGGVYWASNLELIEQEDIVSFTGTLGG